MRRLASHGVLDFRPRNIHGLQKRAVYIVSTTQLSKDLDGSNDQDGCHHMRGLPTGGRKKSGIGALGVGGYRSLGIRTQRSASNRPMNRYCFNISTVLYVMNVSSRPHRVACNKTSFFSVPGFALPSVKVITSRRADSQCHIRSLSQQGPSSYMHCIVLVRDCKCGCNRTSFSLYPGL
jgi:hypothetical protein